MCTIKQADHEITYIVFNPRNEVQIHLNVMKPVVDPGFPRLGAPTARGHQSIIWPISLKNCMNMRKIRSRRRAWVPAPPKSAVANELTIVLHSTFSDIGRFRCAVDMRERSTCSRRFTRPSRSTYKPTHRVVITGKPALCSTTKVNTINSLH